MKITSVETLVCDGGWWPWIFVKVQTDEGITGYGECSDNRINPYGIVGSVKDLAPTLINSDPRGVETLYWQMYRLTRPNLGGVVHKAIAGIEVALWDIKAKALGVPIYELFGGPQRDKVRLYWSHCGTYRALYSEILGTAPLRTMADIEQIGYEVLSSGYTALKTNMVVPGDPSSTVWTSDGLATREILKATEDLVRTFRTTVGEDVDICLDLNFNFRAEGNVQMAKVLEPYDLMWLELDIYDPQALLEIKRSTNIPICSGENLLTSRQCKPYFDLHAMDVAMVDVAWNGFSESRRISALADVCEIPISPHNYYSHLSTLMSAQLCASVPNVKIMEIDVDGVPWKDDLISEPLVIKDGFLMMPKLPGLGADLNEAEVLKHPWTPHADPVKMKRFLGS